MSVRLLMAVAVLFTIGLHAQADLVIFSDSSATDSVVAERVEDVWLGHDLNVTSDDGPFGGRLFSDTANDSAMDAFFEADRIIERVPMAWSMEIDLELGNGFDNPATSIDFSIESLAAIDTRSFSGIRFK